MFPIGTFSQLLHESDIVVIVHLDRRREQRVSLTEDGPDYAHPLTGHDVVRRLETEVQIPGWNGVSLRKWGKEGTHMSLTPLARDGR